MVVWLQNQEADPGGTKKFSTCYETVPLLRYRYIFSILIRGGGGWAAEEEHFYGGVNTGNYY